MADKVTTLPIGQTSRPQADKRSGIAPLAALPAWPSYGLIDDLLPVLERWHNRGHRAALATLVDVRGSSPRPVGSEMAINDAGEIAGYVSGGCVEGAVAAQAREVLITGQSVTLDYGAGSPVLDVQLTCGGRIGIFVRVLPDLANYVCRWNAARSARTTFDVDIDLHDGTVFRQRYLPPPRLIVAGSDPVTLALCRLAPAFGYEVSLLRPYGPTIPPAGTDLIHYDTRPLTRAIGELSIDVWTAVYTLTHDMDDDHQLLMHGLKSSAFCVGALGSRGKAATRLARLRAEGFDEATLARLSTPAGLDIGALNPQEIALSILAETTQRRRRSLACAS